MEEVIEELSLKDFEKLDSELKREQLVDWNVELLKWQDKIVYESDFINKIMKRYKCSSGCVRRKLYSLRDKGKVVIKYTKKGQRVHAIVKFGNKLTK